MTSALMPTYRQPKVRFVSGSGAWLVDEDGKRYLDFLSGIAVTSLGHAHPAVRDAICAQAGTLLHVSNLFANGLNEEVATTLDTLVGDGTPLGGKIFFANSGAEANECAIKLVRRCAPEGRFGIVAADDAFHGRTLATLAATGQKKKQASFMPLPTGFIHVEYGDPDAIRATIRPDTAGVMLEPILGEAGVVTPQKGYLAKVRRICDELGLLFVVDEIQTGMARTGRWFAFQDEGVLPDVVTMAKALGNGVPVGACWARSEVAAAFQPGDHGSTFGGQPLAMSAARSTLETMIAIDAPAKARRAGERLFEGLRSIDGVSEVRGAGLLVGVVLASGIDARIATEKALEYGLVVNDPTPSVIRLCPPIVLSEEEIDEGVDRLDRAITAAASVDQVA
jgi:acetylornithine/N-succinyldiaminopimelate aminotransferase